MTRGRLDYALVELAGISRHRAELELPVPGGGDVDLKRVSRELGARYVVEGSVRRAGDRIRVNAQLIDATSGQHVWAETYDREVADVFALQDEISALIAESGGPQSEYADGLVFRSKHGIPDGCGDADSHFILYVKKVIHRPVIFFCPDMRTIASIDYLLFFTERPRSMPQ